jgi:hypothetical protein
MATLQTSDILDFTIPRHYRASGLIINTDTKLCVLKIIILKWLRTIEERIAEW